MARMCHGKMVLERGTLRAIDCEACGYVHLLPRPTEAQLEQLYRDEYYQAYNAGWFEKEQREWWYWRAVYRQRAKVFGKLTGTTEDRIRFILDYGSGVGWFERALDDIDLGCGIVARSYEPSPEARRWALYNNGVPISYTDFVKDPGFVDFFDLIHASLVLEHLLDPLDFLKRAWQALAPSGLLCIVVPNEFNRYQRELMRRTDYTPIHEHHVNYFTPATLSDLVQRAGFSVTRVASTFPMEWFALHGLNYVKRPKLGKVAHWTRMAIERSALAAAPDKWEAVKQRWARKGVGREIELWARKTG